jgi:hypothetical protein
MNLPKRDTYSQHLSILRAGVQDGAVFFMVRNFIILNTERFLPIRSCKKNGEERVSSEHAIHSISINGEAIIIPAADKKISAVRFMYLYIAMALSLCQN